MTDSSMLTETKLAPGEYKVITLWQPYATLIATGIKRYETRSWPTDYRGPLLIHAAKRPMGTDEMNLINRLRNDYPRLKISRNPEDYPLGAIVCKTELFNCLPAGYPPNFIEKAVGNWHPFRWAWFLTEIVPLDPIPARGYQGFWNYSHSENPHNAEFGS